MVVAGGGAGAEGADGAAAGGGGFGIADGVLCPVRSAGRWEEQERDDGEVSAKERKTRLTALQQNPPQQDSPGTQKVLPQQVDPVGAQKGATVVEVAMQHWSVSSRQQRVFGANISRERGLPPGLKHSQLMSLARRSFALLGKTHASPGVTLR